MSSSNAANSVDLRGLVASVRAKPSRLFSGVLLLVLVAIAATGHSGSALGVAVLLGVGWLTLRLAAVRRRLVLQRAQQLQYLLNLSPSNFERAVADILRQCGYRRVHVVGGAGDLSADITCYDEANRLTIVQCKRYQLDHKVGSPEVQQFIGMSLRHHGAQRMIYVTTSGYTAPALELARRHNVEMIDGHLLIQRAAAAANAAAGHAAPATTSQPPEHGSGRPSWMD